jgi:citrate lyase subunit beta/citryl-CoA lyase
MLEKALGSGADAVMFDLEDSVPVHDKEVARALVRRHLEDADTTAAIYVRVNSWESGRAEQDLEGLVTPALRGIVLPKVETADTVRQIDALLDRLEMRAGIRIGQVDLALALETARGVWFVFDLASVTRRTRTVLIGTAEGGDLQADLRSSWSPAGLELLYARSRVVIGARAAGVDNILDGAYSNFKDQAGLEADSTLSRSLGYRGRMVIHPQQVETANRIYTPTPAEIDFSTRALAALEEAAADNRGATSIDGVMIDSAVARQARAILDQVDQRGRSPLRRSL